MGEKGGCEILTGLHQFQIVVRLQVEGPKRLGQHLAVLTRRKEDRLQRVRLLQLHINRGHLDDLRAGSRHYHNFFSICHSLISILNKDFTPITRSHLDRQGTRSVNSRNEWKCSHTFKILINGTPDTSMRSVVIQHQNPFFNESRVEVL